jgi:glycerol-3-phosphate dehydrogenase
MNGSRTVLPTGAVLDLLVIGGGINGCGIARDAAGRGLSVGRVEMNDLASGTSSWSTKLIHGGLRYIEYYEFRLVREALSERERLWDLAPHVIGPLRFVLPHAKGLRPAWLLRLGLFLYDHLGGRKHLPPTRTLDLAQDEVGRPLKPGLFTRGFEYSDCRVDDARLVVLNARDAADRGAIIRTRTRLINAKRHDGLWQAQVEDTRTGQSDTIHAKRLVNAAGPWVGDVLNTRLMRNTHAKVRLVQGSHIVVKRLYDHDRCYIFQNGDGRIIFAIPYEDDFTLIGTTDLDYAGDPGDVRATTAEIAYLCEAASDYFAAPVTPDQVVWTYSGVRPLYDDGVSEAKAATRDFVLELDDAEGPPLLSVFGGKITTYRRLAQNALTKLGIPEGPLGADWTGNFPLPGGDFPRDGRQALAASLMEQAPSLSPAQAQRLARTYGTRAQRILKRAEADGGFGRIFGGTLTEAEIAYLKAEEWAESADDILWRRTKLGLHMSPQDREALEEALTALKD